MGRHDAATGWGRMGQSSSPPRRSRWAPGTDGPQGNRSILFRGPGEHVSRFALRVTQGPRTRTTARRAKDWARPRLSKRDLLRVGRTEVSAVHPRPLSTVPGEGLTSKTPGVPKVLQGKNKRQEGSHLG